MGEGLGMWSGKPNMSGETVVGGGSGFPNSVAQEGVFLKGSLMLC